jgi:hypothetical protein
LGGFSRQHGLPPFRHLFRGTKFQAHRGPMKGQSDSSECAQCENFAAGCAAMTSIKSQMRGSVRRYSGTSDPQT